MRKKIIFLIVSLAVLFGFSDRVFGQLGALAPEYLPNVNPQPTTPTRITQQDVTPRRGDITNPATIEEIVNGNNVNNEFGAGESSKISQGVSEPIVTNPTPKPPFLTPNYSNTLLPSTTTLSYPVSDIQLGSEYSQNVVIRTYTGNGFAMGWISVVNYSGSTSAPPPNAIPGLMPYSGSTSIGSATLYDEISPYIHYRYEAPNDLAPVTNPGHPTPYYPLTEYSFNKFNATVFQPYPTGSWGEGSGGAGSSYTLCGRPIFQSSVTASGANSIITVWNHNATSTTRTTTVSPTPNPVGIYTSTIDDEFQKIYAPGYYNNSNTVSTTYDFPIDDGIPLVQFNGLEMKSGLALDGQTNPLKSDLSFPDGNINANPSAINPTSEYLANYKRPTTILVDAGSYIFSNFIFKDINWWYEQNRVITTNSYLGNLGSCGSGSSSAFGFSVQWTAAISSTPAATLVDGAIVLVPNALICVTGDVTDGTTNAASIHTTPSSPDGKTDAILTLPNNGRFTLRIKGDYNYLNMYQESTNGDNYYSQASFPTPVDDIYLYPSSTSYAAPFASPLLNGYNGSSLNPVPVANISSPTPTSIASLFGVYLDYNWMTNNADIHTTAFNSTPAQIVDNPGVIEIGQTTAGKSHFHIYSAGILKNFEGCTPITNFTMHFGDLYGDIPNFYLDGEEDLSILNYGNNSTNFCDAKIIFHAGSTAAISTAFLAPTSPGDPGATDEGAFRIQSLYNVEFHEDADIDATLFGNNFYLLSDRGNIIAQKFDIASDYVGTVGQGLITFWAEDSDVTTSVGCANFINDPDANRNGKRGNIYLNDDVEITRTLTTTETNMIAANNIRTASFTANSGNTDDKTNIISRKGDIYLGYSAESNVYSIDPLLLTVVYDSNGKTGDDNKFTYNGTGASGTLNIMAGWDEDDANDKSSQYWGGNIYFTHIEANMSDGNNHATNITIPFSNEYFCGSGWNTGSGMLHLRLDSDPDFADAMMHYEHSGIIGGVGRCGTDAWWSRYAGLLENAGPSIALATAAAPAVPSAIPSLKYTANNGDLNVDAGARGNIIMNTGTDLDFQAGTLPLTTLTGNASSGYFRTRKGDIDLRGETNIADLASAQGVVFLADNGDPNKEHIDCDCDEETNNVYIQDLQYDSQTIGAGSLYFGADNNIKLQYGGLKNIGTWRDPFLSSDAGYPLCTPNYHCDSNPDENKARNLIFNFDGKTEGGVGIVASDLIDIYKKMVYTGGTNSSGMRSVPKYGTLHGENVTGYGLYIKSQGNKKNWQDNPFYLEEKCEPDCPKDACGLAYLHQVARVTFHDCAHICAEGSRVYVGSPVLDVYGTLELNTEDNWVNNRSSLRIQTDSLIVHDSLIIDGSKLQLSAWSNLEYNMPVLKFGHQRFTPPFSEDPTNVNCENCYTHDPLYGAIDNSTALDTIFVTFRNDARFDRMKSLVADHTVLSFLTDSFDHKRGNPVIDAKFFTDIFKVRNQVELWGDEQRNHSGHFELISEPQMLSKDYSGIFARHLHMEPIAPDCRRSYKYSELWLDDRALDVISSSRFGGYGTLHADVHVETQAYVAPGYMSLAEKGNCYEQMAGTLKMKDLRLDKGAQLHFSIGNEEGFDGEKTDIIEVDDLTLYGQVDVFVEVRCKQQYSPGCYPIILYKTVGEQNLNHLILGTTRIDQYPLSLDFSTPGIVYLCVGDNPPPVILRELILPQPPAGVTMTPPAGAHWVPWGQSFTFTLSFSQYVYEIMTNRLDSDGNQEVLTGTLTANGEYEYTIPFIKTQPIYIYIGPNIVANEFVDKDATVWSHGNTLYINVNQQDIASIYSVTGMLVKQIEVPDGGTAVTLQRGVFIVTLKDGSVHKVIIH